MKNKWLFIILGCLVGYYLVNVYFGENKNRSFSSELVQIDTSVVYKIVIAPKNTEAYEILKKDAEWFVKIDGDLQNGDTPSISALLSQIASIKAKQLVSKSKDKWTTYEVDEPNGNRVTLYNKSSALLDDFIVGKFSFNQEKSSALTYIRKVSSDDTYLVDGFLSMAVNRPATDYRNTTVLKLDYPANVKRIMLTKGNDKFTMIRERDTWTYRGAKVDSTKITNYLNTLRLVKGSGFGNAKMVDSLQPTQSITLEMQDGKRKTIKAYQLPGENQYGIKSSEMKGDIITSNDVGIYNTMFTKAFDILK